MNNKKILILLLSSDKYPSPKNEKAQKDTWINDAFNRGIEVINFKGGASNTRFEDHYLYLDTDDSINGVGYKTIEAFRWILKNRDFDILFRVNSSSFVCIDNFIEFVDNIKKENLYCGHIIPINIPGANENIEFISGSGIIFNKKTISSIVSNKKLWDHSLIDDVALGKLMSEIGIEPSAGRLFQLNSSPFKQNIDFSHYHYRCKIEDYGYPRFLESFTIRSLHKETINRGSLKKLWYLHYVFVLLKMINLKYYKFMSHRRVKKWINNQKRYLKTLIASEKK